MDRNIKLFTFVLVIGGLSLSLWSVRFDPSVRQQVIPLPKTVMSSSGKSTNKKQEGLSRRKSDSDAREKVKKPNIPSHPGSLYLTEKEISVDNNIHDHLSWANGIFSKIHLSPRRPAYYLGDDIRVVIQLYDGRRKRRRVGGDFLRLTMMNTQLKASVSGRVIDYNNGTYTGLLKAVWSGQAVIQVMIARKREELAYIYSLYRRYHTLWATYAEFSDGKIKETSTCSVVPETAPNRNPTWCDLTKENGGLPWFCKKPRNTALTCNMWTTSWSSGPKFNLKTLLKFNNNRLWSEKAMFLQKPLLLVVKGASAFVKSPSKPCARVPPEVTWKGTTQNGFFYNDTWHSSLCTDTLPHTRQAYGKCLKTKTLWLHGDSTSGQFYNELSKLFHNQTNRKGHQPQREFFPEYNFSMSWYAHEFPFYHGGTHYKKSANQAEHMLLDRLPNTTEDIVVLYLYVHFLLSHPDVFKRHVKKLAQSAQKLLHRAPRVTLAVRGPHAFYYWSRKNWGGTLLSYWGQHYRDMLRKEFSFLQKRVVFLDFWDITVAKRYSDFHPAPGTVRSMVHNMMSLLCYRITG